MAIKLKLNGAEGTRLVEDSSARLTQEEVQELLTNPISSVLTLPEGKTIQNIATIILSVTPENVGLLLVKFK